MEKKFQLLILSIGFVLFLWLFVFVSVGGDIWDLTWRPQLLKMHLSSHLAMPYFTPGKCGGFLLAASGHDILFSIYMITSLVIPNVVLSVKVANFLLSIIFAVGFSLLLKRIGIKNQITRYGVSILIVISGYWVSHINHGHWPAHGLAYLPFILVLMESILQDSRPIRRQQVGSCLLLSGLFFLLINSGYYWLQIAVPIIGARVIVQFLTIKSGGKNYLTQIGVVVLCGIIGILLSLPRLGGIYEFQVTKFPRAGGAAPHYGIIGDNLILLENLLRSFFDGRIVTEAIHSGMLGSFWEYSNFIGLVSIIAILIGATRLRTVMSSKIFWALLLASVFQLLMTRTSHMAEAVRWLFPIYNQITWYWRGSAILVLLVGVVMALGYQAIFQTNRRWIVVSGVILFLLSFGEVASTYLRSPGFGWKVVQDDIRGNPEKPLIQPFAPCILSNIFGYGNDLPAQLSVTFSVNNDSVFKENQPGFYNFHDIRQLASPQADDGYYMSHKWPLWPKEDKEEFNEFINYRQVVKIPTYLRILNYASLILWFVFIGLGIKKSAGYIITSYRRFII